MAVKLFLKECQLIIKSFIFLVFLGIVILFYISQFGVELAGQLTQAQETTAYRPDNLFFPPPENAESYGTKQADNPEEAMYKALDMLAREYALNEYGSYQTLFYKKISLNPTEQSTVESILYEITGLHFDELFIKLDWSFIETSKGKALYGSEVSYVNGITILISYEEFIEKMIIVDDLIGGASYYEKNHFMKQGSAPVSYEEKLAEYNTFIYEDKVTGAYARYFCDYMGIVLALFSSFVSTSFFIKDRMARSNDLIYSRKISSSKLLLTRYTAIVAVIFTPFLLLSCIPAYQLYDFTSSIGLQADIFAFAKYSIGWLLPSLLTTAAVSLALTLLTDSPIAIAVQFFWGFMSILVSAPFMEGGGYGMNLILRHNSIGNLQQYKDNIMQIAMNRIFYTVFAFILVAFAIFIYEQKRRGRFDVSNFRKIFSYHQKTN